MLQVELQSFTIFSFYNQPRFLVYLHSVCVYVFEYVCIHNIYYIHVLYELYSAHCSLREKLIRQVMNHHL
jgi:hypothetical protein